MSGDLPEDEARTIIATEKFVGVDRLTWDASPTHSAQQVFSCPIMDSAGTTVPGLTLELAFRVPPFRDDCKYTFTVFSFDPGGRRRAYQLEVVPIDDQSHIGDDKICRGPHEHIGEFVQEVRVGDLNCRHHEQWFREFLKRANINFGGLYLGPFDGQLFS